MSLSKYSNEDLEQELKRRRDNPTWFIRELVEEGKRNKKMQDESIGVNYKVHPQGPIRPNLTKPRWGQEWVYKIESVYTSLALGNGTQWKIGMFWVVHALRTKLFFAIEGRGAYTFDGFVHWSYVEEKMNLLEGDARNVADFINAQFGLNDIEQGFYQDCFCHTQQIMNL